MVCTIRRATSSWHQEVHALHSGFHSARSAHTSPCLYIGEGRRNRPKQGWILQDPWTTLPWTSWIRCQPDALLQVRKSVFRAHLTWPIWTSLAGRIAWRVAFWGEHSHCPWRSPGPISDSISSTFCQLPGRFILWIFLTFVYFAEGVFSQLTPPCIQQFAYHNELGRVYLLSINPALHPTVCIPQRAWPSLPPKQVSKSFREVLRDRACT